MKTYFNEENVEIPDPNKNIFKNYGTFEDKGSKLSKS